MEYSKLYLIIKIGELGSISSFLKTDGFLVEITILFSVKNLFMARSIRMFFFAKETQTSIMEPVVYCRQVLCSIFCSNKNQYNQKCRVSLTFKRFRNVSLEALPYELLPFEEHKKWILIISHNKFLHTQLFLYVDLSSSKMWEQTRKCHTSNPFTC